MGTQPKKWVAFAALGDDDCSHTPIEEIPVSESVLEAKERIIFSTQLPWRAMEPNDIEPEDRKCELENWDTFVFTSEDEVTKLKDIDLPDYPDLGFAVSETMWSVYKAFADEFISGEEE